MKVISQPTSYSEILERIFICTLVTGVLCSFFLAEASPNVRAFFNIYNQKADLGPIKNLSALYVIIPLAIAFFSRMFKLHDKISDIFNIRLTFDIRFFLYPLCHGVNLDLNDTRKKAIKKNRDDAMYQTVYKYASFNNPVIDVQLVRTAADNWGWFWVCVESTFLFLVSAVIAAFMKKINYYTGFLISAEFGFIIMLIKWFACINSAAPQVRAILSDDNRIIAIREYFQRLTEGIQL